MVPCSMDATSDFLRTQRLLRCPSHSGRPVSLLSALQPGETNGSSWSMGARPALRFVMTDMDASVTSALVKMAKH